MTRKTRLAFLLLFFAVPSLKLAGADAVPRVALPLLSKPPTIDGVIEEEEWQGAARSVGFISHRTGVKTARRGVFWVGCGRAALYLAIRTETPPGGRILVRAPANAKRDIKAAFHDDSIELVIDPKRHRPKGDRTFYHLITNARGALYDRAINPENKQNPSNFSWRIPAWTYRNRVVGDEWDIEIAIPLGSLGVTPKDLARPWGLRIARNWKRPYEQSQWTPICASYVDQPSMPIVVWDAQAPVVQVLQLQDEGDSTQSHVVVTVRNPHDRALTVRARLSDAWHSDQPKELDRRLVVKPGDVERLELRARDGGAEGLHHTTIHIESPDAKKVYYFRQYRWSAHRPKQIWTIEEEQKKAIDLKFKYYPYFNKIRFRLDVSSLDSRREITAATASIHRLMRDGRPRKRALWVQPVELQRFVHEGIYDIPHLNDGRYRFAVQLRGGKETPKNPAAEDFVRRHYDWEHNQLGISDRVMPPFEPLTVRGAMVRCVLREHEHGPSGLWRRVTSMKHDLLAAPMGWEVEVGDAGVQDARGRGWHAVRQSETAVVGEARWTAGPLTAAVRTEYDYDGMMLVHLTLAPTKTPVRRLSIVIPVVEREARYMHAVADGLRHNYAGFVPSGEGRVWDSSKGNRIDLVGTFYPYLWVGGGERGLCFFADNDRGWLLDDQTPTIDLTRRHHVLTMRVHFITRPGLWAKPRRITFGLQATPTKPMPKGWRRWVATKRVSGGRTVSWIGHSMYWGGLYYLVYPLGKRFEFYDRMAQARRTGQLPKKFIQRWMGYVAQVFPPDDPMYEKNERSIHAGLFRASRATWDRDIRLFGYTNARGVNFLEPEFETFQDEWLRFDWFHRRWEPPGRLAYDVSPSPSFVDRAVWYYRKMLKCFDGVYWDCMYLSAHYDPVVGGAWRDEAGRVHPGTGLLHLRNLVKRTAIMHWQASQGMRGRHLPFIQLSHMTNSMVVPVLSFGNCNMDWEWRYGYTDFQDRFTADLTVAETIGRQVGAWPMILAGGVFNPKDPRLPRVQRTRLAVELVHEFHNCDWRPASDAALYARLFQWGYGLPDCKVFNYWDDPHPATVQGADVRTLVMARHREAIVVVTDYGNGGQCRLTLGLRKLGVSEAATATDFETGETFERTGPGRFRFAIAKHDMEILHVK